MYLLAKRFSGKNNVAILIGAKDSEHLAYRDEFAEHGRLQIATEDGSVGIEGTVVDLFKEYTFKQRSYFFNCGPRAMVDAILPLELKISSRERIYSSVDYMTRCGVGICGSCADEKGRRTCVEGPFMPAD